MQLPAVDTGLPLLTTAGTLFLLLGAIFLAYWLLKRFGISGAMGGPGSPRLISRLMLGNNQAIAVVRYKDKDMLLGVTDASITLLSQEEADEENQPVSMGPSFSSFLKRSKNNETEQ